MVREDIDPDLRRFIAVIRKLDSSAHKFEQYRALVNGRDDEGYTPLVAAIVCGNSVAAKEILAWKDVDVQVLNLRRPPHPIPSSVPCTLFN